MTTTAERSAYTRTGNSRFHYSRFHVHTSDPTHTLTLRNAFTREMGRRFKELQRSVRIAIIDDDCFGLDRSKYLQVHAASGTGRQVFAFPRTQAKVAGFMNWFDQKVNSGILEMHRGEQIGQAIESAWTNKYVKAGYERGVERGRREMMNAGYDVPPLEATGGMWGALNSPMHLDRVGVLYTRTFTGLKGITAAMDMQVSQVLASGLAEGLGPVELARQLTRTIGSGLGMTDKLGRFIPAERRAKTLARTEVIRAHHQGTIQEYENWRVEGVYVKAEWETAGDDRVCEECATLEGSIFTLEEIRPMIPRHPMCRCVALPIEAPSKKGKGIEVPIEREGIEAAPSPMIDAVAFKKDVKARIKVAKKAYWGPPIGKRTVPFSAAKNVRPDILHKLNTYVSDDLPPTGKIGKALDALVKRSGNTTADFTSYRGMVMPKGFSKKLQAQLAESGEVSFKLRNPSSWTASDSTAWDFAKEGGHRFPKGTAGKEPVLLEVLIPKGTKVAPAPFTFNIPVEHILHSGTLIDIVEVKKFRKGWKLIGEVRQ